MNDHLAKPINPPELFATISRWVKANVDDGKAVSTGSVRQSDLAPDNGVWMPAIAGIDTSAGLSRTGGKPQFYLDLLQRFVARHRNCVGEITNAIAAADFDTAQRIAHTVKGVAGTIGADELSEAARRVEAAMKAREDDPDALATLADRLGPIVDAIARIPRKPEPAADKTAALATAGDCAEQLLRLRKLLAAGDGDATDFMAEIAPTLAGVLAEEELASLSREVGDFDFPTALATLDEVSRRLSLELA